MDCVWNITSSEVRTNTSINITSSHYAGESSPGVSLTDVFDFIVCTVIVMGNVLVLVCVPTLKRLSKAARLSLIHISISELCITVGKIVRVIAKAAAGSNLNRSTCTLILAFVWTGIGTSEAGLNIFAFNNMRTVKNMTKKGYSIKVKTSSITHGVIWGVWTVLALIIPISFAGPEKDSNCFLLTGCMNKRYFLIMSLSYIINAVLLTTFQLSTVYFLRKQTAFLQAGAENRTNTEMNHSWLQMRRDIVVVILLLWATCLISHAPLNIVLFIYHVCPSHCGLSPESTAIPAMLTPVKSALVFIIYLARIPDFREAVGDIMRNCFGIRNSSSRIPRVPVVRVEDETYNGVSARPDGRDNPDQMALVNGEHTLEVEMTGMFSSSSAL
jgi:hypothetical protein